MLPQYERSAGDDMGRLSPGGLRVPCTRRFDSLHRNRRELAGDERNKEWSAGSEIDLESELIGRVDTKFPRRTLARGDVEGYADALERDAGPEGRKLARAVADGQIRPLWETRPTDYPLAGEVLGLASGLIVHSRYVEERARAAGYSGPVWQVPMPAWPVPDVEPAELEGSPLLGAFGHVNESKRMPQLFEAFDRLRARRPDARLFVVGAWSPRYADLGVPEGVIRRDYVPEDELWRLLGACDAVVSLRWPTMGETSAAAIRALSLGKPLVVSDVGWFAELPGSVAAKVPIGEGEIEQLERALEQTATSPEMGAAALDLARSEHALDRVADLYAAALREAAELEEAA